MPVGGQPFLKVLENTMKIVSTAKCFKGNVVKYSHTSKATASDMKFIAYMPDLEPNEKCPFVIFLSGLTCNEVFMLIGQFHY